MLAGEESCKRSRENGTVSSVKPTRFSVFHISENFAIMKNSGRKRGWELGGKTPDKRKEVKVSMSKPLRGKGWGPHEGRAEGACVWGTPGGGNEKVR